MLVVSGRREFPRWLDRLLSVGPGCAGAVVILMFLPGLTAWAVTGDAELRRRLARALAGWGFGPVAVACGLFWFALPYWGAFSVPMPSRGMRWTAVGMGACFWGVGVGLSAWVLEAPDLFAVCLGLGAGLVGVVAGWLLTRWLEVLGR